VPPTEFQGAGETSLGIQFMNLAPFGAYQNVDAYVQPMKPSMSGAAPSTVPDGDPLRIATGVRWRGLAPSAVGVRLTAATKELSTMLLVKHGEPPFCGGAEGCTNTIVVPIEPFLERYASAMGGATGAAWGGNEVFALFGRIPLAASEQAADFVRLGMFSGFVDENVVNRRPR